MSVAKKVASLKKLEAELPHVKKLNIKNVKAIADAVARANGLEEVITITLEAGKKPAKATTMEPPRQKEAPRSLGAAAAKTPKAKLDKLKKAAPALGLSYKVKSDGEAWYVVEVDGEATHPVVRCRSMARAEKKAGRLTRKVEKMEAVAAQGAARTALKAILADKGVQAFLTRAAPKLLAQADAALALKEVR